ncbi:MAG TPA: lipase maturation factor family protein [Terriglobales bacterium]|nr:lipase maturation factor family protein [Terriglobales bacterium]
MNRAEDAAERPVLVFDGECDFCRVWVDYWKRLTGERVEYVSFQEIGERFPRIPREDFAAAVQLMLPGGEARSGAHAAFTLLASLPGKRWMLWMYERVPLAGLLAEAFYGWVARHRPLALRATKLLWGTPLEPESVVLVEWLFLKALAVIYAIAFASLAVQVTGLVGSRGVEPLADFLPRAREVLGTSAYLDFPTIFWLSASDTALRAACWAGVGLSALLFFGIARRAVCAVLLVLYLSLTVAGQDFMSFQWDALLLEAGFLAIFLGSSQVVLRLYRWLLFRLLFLSGMVKLTSGDPAWRSLAALSYHYETQPLPTPLAWYMHQLPLGFHKLEAVLMFGAELGVPFLFFAPRRIRHLGALATLGFQALIFLTGNYTFFNLLAVALCLFLLDDALLGRAVPRARRKKLEAAESRRRRPKWLYKAVAVALAVFILTVSSYEMAGEFFRFHFQTADRAMARIYPLRLVNTYGLFAIMTTSREEIVIEGSNDGVTWQEYEFPYKPGDVGRRPPWVEPHQPRLDWQMWFAALGSYQDNPWVLRLMERLLEGEPAVLRLLEKNPFPGHPPKYVRALLYDYRFTTPEERRQTGAWWARDLRGLYVPPVSLKDIVVK